MTRFGLKSCVLLALAACAQASSNGGTQREWRFQVTLDGKPIGEHSYVLHEDEQGRELESEALFRVKFIFLEAYRYEHHAKEWWQGDCLTRLDARTNTNGQKVAVSGVSDSGAFRLTAANGSLPLGDCVQTFAYWNPGILEAKRLLNPQTGEYVEIKVMPMGRDDIDGEPTERFRLLGKARTPLEIDLWYTPTRDWVALESRTPEGRVLRYTRK